MTVQDFLSEAVRLLSGASITEARRDTEVLLAHVLGKERTWLLAHGDETLDAALLSAFNALVERRAGREPLQYILGEVEFYGLRLRVTPDTLIPRPETELLVEAVLMWAAQQGSASLRLADIGTGTGAIALALAAHLPAALIFASDISAAALDVARENARLLGCDKRIVFFEGDLLQPLPAQPPFDSIVSNPPYVPSGDANGMQPEVRDHEPHSALFAGEDGLAVYRRLIPQARATLRASGLLAMEIGFGQREAVGALLAQWRDVRFIDDYAGIPRVALAHSPGE